MGTVDSLVGNFLIAMPSLADPNFRRSVVLLGAHSLDDGAFGLIVNRPIEIDLSEILRELGLEIEKSDFPRVLAGGPVEPSHGFVLFELNDRPLESDDLLLPEGLTVSGNTETLAAFASGKLSGTYSLILGYSGWFPGQLETEIEENSWLLAPIKTSIVFDTPCENRWEAALNSIGVDPGTLVDTGSGTPA